MLPLCVDSSVYRYIVAVMQRSTEAAFPTFGYSKIQLLVGDQYCSQRLQQSLFHWRTCIILMTKREELESIYSRWFTVLCTSVGLKPHGVETRVIIKISSHPCYPRTAFQEEKNTKRPTQKNYVFKILDSLLFLWNWAGLVFPIVFLEISYYIIQTLVRTIKPWYFPCTHLQCTF